MLQRWRTVGTTALVLAVVVLVGADLSFSRDRKQSEVRRALHHQEQQVKRARRVTRRILNDHRASDAIKGQASELDQLLDERERALKNLERLHKDFMAQHRADIDELQRLRRQAVQIDTRLREGRKQVLQSHQAEVDNLTKGAERAQELIQNLNLAYGGEKRERRRAP